MATELSNYANDYRLRYRQQNTGSITGWFTPQAPNPTVLLPDEEVYGLYGGPQDPLTPGLEVQNSVAWEDPIVSDDINELPDLQPPTGEFQGRYTLDFALTEPGNVGLPLSINDVNVPRGENPPSSPSPGALWFDTSNLQLMVYIDDGNSTQWVAAS